MASFEGEVNTQWLWHAGPDRQMRLLNNFTFVDDRNKRWTAPKNSDIDGASIPSLLWSSQGSPFVGDYRRATVIHDVYCKSKAEPHRAVHRMFYEAMLCDGVPRTRAQKMYTAVRLFGPKWSVEQTVRANFGTLSVADERVLSLEELEDLLDQVLGEF